MSTTATLREDLFQLLAVQAVDSKLDAARARLAALDTGATTADTYNRGKVAFEQERSLAVKTQGAQKEIELRLQTIEDKRAKAEKELYGGKTTGSRELANLQAEIDMLLRQKSTAEDATLEAMEAAQSAMTAAQNREASLKALAERHKQLRTRYKADAAVLTDEIAALEAERAGAAQPIPPALLSRYDQIRARKGGIGISLLTGEGVCQGCHTRIGGEVQSAVRAAVVPTGCESCGRLLTLAPPT